MADDETRVGEYAAHLESVLAEGGLSTEELAEIREVLARIEAKRSNSGENEQVDETALDGSYHEPETTVVDRPTGAAPVHAWSEADDTEIRHFDDHEDDEDIDDEPKLNRRQRELLNWLKPDDDVWNDDDDARYTRGTVAMFVSLMAVAVIGAAWLVHVWMTHRDETRNAGSTTQSSWVTEGQVTPSPTTEQAAPTSEQAAPPPSTEAAPAPSTDALPTQKLDGVDAHFISFIRQNDAGGKYADVSDARLITNAHLVCTDMQNKSNFDNVAVNLDLSNGGVAWFADTASANYCPQFGGDN